MPDRTLGSGRSWRKPILFALSNAGNVHVMQKCWPPAGVTDGERNTGLGTEGKLAGNQTKQKRWKQSVRM